MKSEIDQKKGFFWKITRVPNLLSCSPLPWDDNTRECWTRGENCNINFNCLGFPSRINISLKRYYWFVYLFVYTLPYPLHPVAFLRWSLPQYEMFATMSRQHTKPCDLTQTHKAVYPPQFLRWTNKILESLKLSLPAKHQTVKNTKLLQSIWLNLNPIGNCAFQAQFEGKCCCISI